MSYLDNIKALATELANMAPKTQMELIKLCKDLCINTKNYLVAFDETTLPALDARIEALETLTSNLSSELNTAEGNIQANANAISTINDTIDAIQTALSNVYTKTQIDTMLASYYTKSQIDTMFASYYNKTEVDTALSGKANTNDVYTKSQVDTALNGKANTNDVYTKTEVDTALSGKANTNDVYTKTEVDTALSGKASLTSDNTFTGSNRFNGLMYLGQQDAVYLDYTNTILYEDEYGEVSLSDAFNRKQNKLYLYEIRLCDEPDGSGVDFYVNVLSRNATLNISTLADVISLIDTNTIMYDSDDRFYIIQYKNGNNSFQCIINDGNTTEFGTGGSPLYYISHSLIRNL